uniref:Protein tipE n=1 Tax=Schizaphis graminum TaxID=13262 RepID=A0A2S2NYM8_SCHGA
MDDDGPAAADNAAAAIEQQLEKQQREEAEKKRLEELRERVLFYLTTFFILLGIVSLFVFLFLVPFLIEPAITTILMEFDETPTTCVTAHSEIREGASNCSLPGGWASCREGCTREIYECAQIFVNYTVPGDRVRDLNARHRRSLLVRGYRPIEPQPASGWTYSLARIYPNVKGCGYPPHLNCTEFRVRYFEVGASYPCYYSRVEPWVVITELDLAKSTRQLVYSMVFPIPCFVVSVVYVALAYFCVYAGRHRKPKVKRRVVRRMVGGGGGVTGSGVGTGSAVGYGCGGGGGSGSRAKSGSEATPLTNNSSAAAAPTSPIGTGTPGSEQLYRRRGDRISDINDYDDDDASETYYGDQLRSTLGVDDSIADYVNTLRLSEHTLRQSDSNEPSRGEWSDENDDCEASVCDSSLERSIKTVATSASQFPTNSTGNLTKTMTTCILTPPGPTAEV